MYFKEWLLNKLKKIKSKDEERFYQISKKFIPRDLKRLQKLYIELIFVEEYLETMYGIDSQILLNYKDALNFLSIDKDRD